MDLFEKRPFVVTPERIEFIVRMMSERAWIYEHNYRTLLKFIGGVSGGEFYDCLHSALDRLYPENDVEFSSEFELLVRACLSRMSQNSRNETQEVDLGLYKLAPLNAFYLKRFRKHYEQSKQDVLHYGYFEHNGHEYRRWVLEIAFEDAPFDFLETSMGSIRKRDLAVA